MRVRESPASESIAIIHRLYRPNGTVLHPAPTDPVSSTSMRDRKNPLWRRIGFGSTSLNFTGIIPGSLIVSTFRLRCGRRFTEENVIGSNGSSLGWRRQDFDWCSVGGILAPSLKLGHAG